MNRNWVSSAPTGAKLRWMFLGSIRALALVWLVASTGLSIAQGTGGAGGAGAPAAVPAARQAPNVAIITIRDEITEVTGRSVERRMRMAERAGADALVFEIDTPGGDVRAVLHICGLIKKSPVKNTVAWVNTQAYSGGAIIALACREIVCSDAAVLGDAIPIAVDPVRGLRTIGESERQKILAPIIAELVSSARRHGRDELLVQGIATTGVELWLVEHKETRQRLCITREEYRVLFGEEPASAPARLTSARSGALPEAPADATPGSPGNDPTRYVPASPKLSGIADSVSDEQQLASVRPVLTPADAGEWAVVEYVSTGSGPFIFQADDLIHFGLATQMVASEEELRAFFGARHLLRLDQNWSESLVAFMTNMYVRAVLVVIFLISLFLEMTNPGLVLPGAVAAVSLVALLAPPMLISLASWWEVAAIVVGIGLIALEVLVIPGFGVFGIVGLLALFGGLVGTFVPQGGMFPDTPGQRMDLLYGVITLVMAVATSGVIIYFVSKHFASLPLFSRLVLKDPAGEDDSADDLIAAMGDPLSGPLRPGMTGVAVTPLRPAGRVEVGGQIIDVVADMGFIAAGAPVRVVEVTPFRVTVEPADKA